MTLESARSIGAFGPHREPRRPGPGGSTQDTCDPAGLGFATRAAVGLTVPPGPGARALVLGRVQALTEDDFGGGTCRLATSTVGAVPDSGTSVRVNGDYDVAVVTLIGISPPLGPGVHSFGIDCNETSRSIDYREASVKVVGISPN